MKLRVAWLAMIAACGAPQTAERHPEPHHESAATYVGSRACAPCHQDIYDRWKKTPMANVIRDPRVDPAAITPDLATNDVAPFRREDVAFVYGSIWKQRYFTKIGDDYFPEPAQWDVTHKKWRKYFVDEGTDWWVPFYPPDNMKRPTGPLCDGCHSVGYDVKTKTPAEWNVGCERCHGAGSEHVAHPTTTNIVNPAHMDDAHADDVCIQCHSQGRPLVNPIEGRMYDWPVGYRVGLNLSDFWKLEDHTLGQTTFTHFADGTAHKNRMQGNDFLKSVMSHHGIVCSTCHDVHGTPNAAQMRKPGSTMCLTCHSPGGANGPHQKTFAAHTGHADGSAGSDCLACHMPKIEKTIADVNVRAHTFDFIKPQTTDKYGTPNPCTSCHKDKTTAWAAEILARR